MFPRFFRVAFWSASLLVSFDLNASAEVGENRCGAMRLADDSVIHAPRPAVGSAWTYSVGQGVAPSTLRLERIEEGEGLYSAEASGRVWPGHREQLNTYTQVNPLREGEQVMLRFPLHVGATWEDSFVEPGEIQLSSGSFRYTYQEWAVSEVVSVEEVTIGLGSFSAFRIERTARWVKSRPESDDLPHMLNDGAGEVDGIDRSVSWYVPEIGRVVMRMAQTMHPSYARFSRIDAQSAATLITELVAYSDPGGCALEGAPLHATLPQQAPMGYPFRDNNTWEYMLQTRPHRAQRVAAEP